MLTRQTTSAYQNATASGATQAGLLQLVYSHLAQDLLRAAEAVGVNNIEARCASSNHALLLLGHLESWLDCLEEPTLAESLRGFYRMLSNSILQLQAAPDALLFEKAAQLVLDTRAVWQLKEQRLSSTYRDTAALPAIGAGSISFSA